MNQPTIISVLEPGLFVLFLALAVLFIYFGITLTHHWNYYSFNVQIKRIMKGLYFFVSTFVLLALLFFIGLYISGYGI
jgi:choline-glycine betaine transporter